MSAAESANRKQPQEVIDPLPISLEARCRRVDGGSYFDMAASMEK